MLLAATSEAVMCLSFAFMQLTLSWQQPASRSHLRRKRQPPGVGRWLRRCYSHPVRRAFPCSDDTASSNAVFQAGRSLSFRIVGLYSARVSPSGPFPAFLLTDDVLLR